MNERFTDHERLTLISRARDIMLHTGERATNPETGNSYIVSEEWHNNDATEECQQVRLISDGIYKSSFYAVDLRSMTTSSLQRYYYNVIGGKFSYESPPGTPMIGYDGTTTARNMLAWIATRPTPDSIEYDSEGTEEIRQSQFARLAARTAIQETLALPEGQRLFTKLCATNEISESNRLHREFYSLSRRPEASFNAEPMSIYRELEKLMARPNPKQLPAAQSDSLPDELHG